MGQWLAGHVGVTVSEGLRWTTAAHALEHLPVIAAAFETGVLSLDKVLQLARFATPDTEKDLLKWAKRASVNAIWHRADLANRPPDKVTRAAYRERYLWWSWYDDGTRVGIDAMLPADSGHAVITAIQGIAASLPREPAEDAGFEQRCADALVALATAPSQESEARTEVVLSADLRALGSDDSGCEFETGPVIHPEIARRISCDCRLRAVLRDPLGRAVGIGRRSRNVPGWLLRELYARDHGCCFPGCGTRRFTAAHHIVHWGRGGPTELGNLVLVCSFHHKLVHEGGWRVTLRDGLEAEWFRPYGGRYQPGPPRAPSAAGAGARVALVDSS
ncbi:MAG: HNH endonuclease, partial [Actinomycetota bacterium]|nr:HNH endonuclease [Actinomycetota bacterium]